MLTAKQMIDWLKLQANEAEGGYFVGTYQSPLSSAIYYFLDASGYSAMHRVTGDMIYHFYTGDPVQMLLLYPDGSPVHSEICVLSNDIAAGGSPTKVIPGGTWIGSRLIAGGSYALMGVTMAPAFDVKNYSLGNRKELIKKYPEQAALISDLSKETAAGIIGDKTNAFLNISVFLTGFNAIELLGTGMLDTYYNKLLERAMGADLSLFFSRVDEVLKEGAGNEDQTVSLISQRIMADPVCGNLAKKIITMWYLGNWIVDADNTEVVSGEAYIQALVWPAAQTHVPGAKQPGFASWGYSPE